MNSFYFFYKSFFIVTLFFCLSSCVHSSSSNPKRMISSIDNKSPVTLPENKNKEASPFYKNIMEKTEPLLKIHKTWVTKELNSDLQDSVNTQSLNESETKEWIQACNDYLKLSNNPEYPLYQITFWRWTRIYWKLNASDRANCQLGNESEQTKMILLMNTKIKQFLNDLESDLKNLENKNKSFIEIQLTATESYLKYQLQNNQKEKNNHTKLLSLVYLQLSKLKTHPTEKLNLLKKSIDLDVNQKPYLEIYFPRFTKTPQPADYYKVALDFLKDRNFNQARNYLKKIYNSNPGFNTKKLKLNKKTKKPNRHLEYEFSSDEKIQAYKTFRNSFKTEGNKNLYINACRSYSEFVFKHGSESQKLESMLIWGRALWTEGKNASAEKTFLKIIETFKNESTDLTNEDLSETYWVLGKFYQDKNQIEKAIFHYQKAHDLWIQKFGKKEPAFFKDNSFTPNKPRDLINKINFSLAWLYYKSSQWAMAEKIFLQAIEESTDVGENFKFSFWLAKTLQKKNNIAESKEIFKNIITNDLFGYYGLISYKELNLPLPNLSYKMNLHNFLLASTETDNIENLKVLFLWMAQEDDILKNHIQDEFNNPKQMEDFLWLALGYDFLPLFGRLNKLSDEEKTFIYKFALNLIFPLQYTNIIEKNANSFSVPKELIYSIIRQESAFNPMARSPADAFGLMQVLGKPNFSSSKLNKLKQPEDLYHPEINIQYGTYLLSSLLKKYNGRCSLAAASYNAPESAVKKWIATAKKQNLQDSFEFIEDIPYEETRVYVKLVLRNFAFYQRLITTNQLNFPGHCLPLNESK